MCMLHSLAHDERQLGLTAHVLANVCLGRHLSDAVALVEFCELHFHHLQSTKKDLGILNSWPGACG